MLILPDDVADYGYDPQELDIARAVRMSMSIPFFFRPVKLPVRRQSSLHEEEGRPEVGWIVDGGLLSNFPVELFDAPGAPAWPTFGFKLAVDDPAPLAKFARYPVHGLVSLLEALFHTALEAHDAYYLKAAKFVRTIAIDTSGVSGTDFHLTAEQKSALYAAGQAAARAFLAHWDFARYVAEYRSDAPIAPRTMQAAPQPPRTPRANRLHAAVSADSLAAAKGSADESALTAGAPPPSSRIPVYAERREVCATKYMPTRPMAVFCVDQDRDYGCHLGNSQPSGAVYHRLS
jgi:predicted acylesterase/phospholipase RssA